MTYRAGALPAERGFITISRVLLENKGLKALLRGPRWMRFNRKHGWAYLQGVLLPLAMLAVVIEPLLTLSTPEFVINTATHVCLE